MLVPEQRPLPQPGDGEVLVKVAVAGVNRPDVMQRQGNYPPPPGAPPDIPGLEIAGEVVAVGEMAALFKLGDAVTALVPGGGYAEYCKVDQTNALPVPAGAIACSRRSAMRRQQRRPCSSSSERSSKILVS